MIIETDRMQLIPLTLEQLKLWTENIGFLERELDCNYQAEPMDGFFGEIVKGQIEKIKDDEVNYIYHSFWLLIRKSDRVVIGSAGFKNSPNENGEIEIGYGLGKKFEGGGYMTEAVQAMCDWALQQGQVKNVIAETEPGNPKSERVLERCGFTIYKKDINTWWRI